MIDPIRRRTRLLASLATAAAVLGCAVAGAEPAFAGRPAHRAPAFSSSAQSDTTTGPTTDPSNPPADPSGNPAAVMDWWW